MGRSVLLLLLSVQFTAQTQTLAFYDFQIECERERSSSFP